MREIKFRAWDKETKQMVVRDLDTFAKFGCPFVPMQEAIENGEIMQYTGLKDKNGKEIYEGDIVKGWVPDPEKDEDISNATIEYHGSSFDVYEGKTFVGDLESCTLNRSIEVVGNIYENKELLSKERG